MSINDDENYKKSINEFVNVELCELVVATYDIATHVLHVLPLLLIYIWFTFKFCVHFTTDDKIYIIV